MRGLVYSDMHTHRVYVGACCYRCTNTIDVCMGECVCVFACVWFTHGFATPSKCACRIRWQMAYSVYTCTYMYLYTHTHTHTRAHVTCKYSHTHKCIAMPACVCRVLPIKPAHVVHTRLTRGTQLACSRTCVLCIPICLCVCTHVHICIHICTHKPSFFVCHSQHAYSLSH